MVYESGHFTPDYDNLEGTQSKSGRKDTLFGIKEPRERYSGLFCMFGRENRILVYGSGEN
ncbi:hypothetical protein CH363_13520 [Leptospira haakeii]|uniref:Uncharacterized protein n=1 Tax=Leptospira haakeii TaxID=2023198 RepID=A0ABX4PMI6_9LEPT|nr:hypothetical protein CH363_13520 [Leptospira haakeii]PKA18152.1 hypothetical protein CH377_19100 [Leptospira haakeii]